MFNFLFLHQWFVLVPITTLGIVVKIFHTVFTFWERFIRTFVLKTQNKNKTKHKETIKQLKGVPPVSWPAAEFITALHNQVCSFHVLFATLSGLVQTQDSAHLGGHFLSAGQVNWKLIVIVITARSFCYTAPSPPPSNTWSHLFTRHSCREAGWQGKLDKSKVT